MMYPFCRICSKMPVVGVSDDEQPTNTDVNMPSNNMRRIVFMLILSFSKLSMSAVSDCLAVQASLIR